ncbi:MAG: hypothetical protein QXN77_07320 [Candidatus Caldarchaeum sp.]
MSYVVYLLGALLFVSNFGDALKLVLRRQREAVLKLRNNWGQIRMNVDDFLIWITLLWRRVIVSEFGGKIFTRYCGGVILLPSVGYAGILVEPFEELYRAFDLRGKRVLDVGGYLGETAYLFHKWGAAHVTVYEPDPTLGKFVELNLRINRVNGGFRPLFVDACCSSKSVDWNTVLSEKFDIAKVDCEGCEVFLLDVADEVLAKVPEWVIECHSPAVLHKLGRKFSKAGFSVRFKPYYWGGPLYNLAGKFTSIGDRMPKTTSLTLLYAKYIVDNSMPSGDKFLK